MHFTRFGITLHRLERDDLEMVRQWRNSDQVRSYMRYREFIEPEEQTRWFEGLSAEDDWYFIARAGDAPFAVFDIKAVDWNAACGESGGFVGDPRYTGRPEPGQATLALMDFGFQLLHLESLQACYSARHPRIIRFNENLGYVISREGDDGFLHAAVNPERYLQSAARLRKAAITLHGNAAVLTSPSPWLLKHMHREPARYLPDLQLEVRANAFDAQ